MTGIGPGAAVNISSVVVNPHPGWGWAVRMTLEEMAGVEVHAVSSDGRILITLECPGDGEAAEAFEAVRRTTGVLSAALVYMHTEENPNQEICDEIDAS